MGNAATEANFRKLYSALMEKDFVAGGNPPFGDPPKVSLIKEKIEAGKSFLPTAFLEGYADPLSRRLDSVIARLRASSGPGAVYIETVTGAVYQHADTGLQPALNRFLAVVSNLYQSFLDARKRSRLKLKLSETVPPLAAFQSDPTKGPFTWEYDKMAALIGGSIGVVSLPHTFAHEPLFYGCLAHETGGHDVIHADPDLLPEMRAAVQARFRKAEMDWLGLLWDYWMDEAAADIYGLLNMGPSFGLSTALFLSVFVPQLQKAGPKDPVLRHASEAGEDGSLDVHPTDILRLALIEGAVGSLQELSSVKRRSYVRRLSGLSEALAPKANTVGLTGTARVASGRLMTFDHKVRLATMQETARQVGAMIATHPFSALGGHSIQDIETWDEADEEAAEAIAKRLQSGLPAAGFGDDAQILAGLTLAALRRPDGYETASAGANRALDHSFATDPYWGHAPTSMMLVRPARGQDRR